MLAIPHASPKSQPGSERRRRSVEGAPGARADVLVADDDPSFVALVERYLVLAGFRVKVANDGGEALEMRPIRWKTRRLIRRFSKALVNSSLLKAWALKNSRGWRKISSRS